MNDGSQRRWNDRITMLLVTVVSALVIAFVLYLVGGLSRSTG